MNEADDSNIHSFVCDYPETDLDKALRHAIYDNDLISAKDHIAHGANIAKHEHCLLEAAVHAENLDIIKYFAELGANVHKYAWAMSRFAVQTGNLEMIKYWVENGENVNVASNEGNILMYAAECPKKEVMQYLIERGAKIEPELTYVLVHIIYAGEVETAKYILGLGLDLSGWHGKTEMGNLALERDQPAIAKLLLNY
jgi:ankyrin repeat protein